MHCGILDWILDQKKKKLEGTTGEKEKYVMRRQHCTNVKFLVSIIVHGIFVL